MRRCFAEAALSIWRGGHGLLAQAMMLLDDSSPQALVVDRKLPPSAVKLHRELVRAWPRLAERVTFAECELGDVALLPTDIVVSSHACGALTDVVLERAAAARARVAVLPCCHNLAKGDAADLSGWVDRALAIDILRALRLRAAGYSIRTQTIPAAITPKNRLLLAEWHGSP